MRLKIMSIMLTALLFTILGNKTFADCPEFTAKDALSVDTNNPKNIRIPIFKWPKCEEAVSYQLYVGSSVNESQETQFEYLEELAFGDYEAFVYGIKETGEVIAGQKTPFTIGIRPPKLLSPAEGDKLWNTVPILKFEGSTGAMGYEVVVLDEHGNEVSLNEWDLGGSRDGYGGESIKPRDFKVPKAKFNFEPGKEYSWFARGWIVVDRQKINPVKSKARKFAINKLNPPEHVTPKNGASFPVKEGAGKRPLQFTHELMKVGEDVSLTLYVTKVSPEKGKIKDEITIDNYKDLGTLIPEINYDPLEGGIQWEDLEDVLEVGPEYEWYIVATKEDQIAVTPAPWLFKYTPPLGINVGIKAGANSMRTTNALSQLRFQPGGGAYINFTFARAAENALLFKAQLDMIFESRSVGFAVADNPQFLTDDLSIINFTLNPALLFRVDYDFMMKKPKKSAVRNKDEGDTKLDLGSGSGEEKKEDDPFFNKIGIYGMVGAEVPIVLKSLITNKNQTMELPNSFATYLGVNLVIAAGVNFSFAQVKLFESNLELGLELRYIQGLTSFIQDSTFLGQSGSTQQELALMATWRIFAF